MNGAVRIDLANKIVIQVLARLLNDTQKQFR